MLLFSVDYHIELLGKSILIYLNLLLSRAVITLVDHVVFKLPNFIMCYRLSGYERRSGIHVLIVVCWFLLYFVHHMHFNILIL
jgi:hypothetical protein